jgi:outer membrane biosynthesis protein TonB
MPAPDWVGKPKKQVERPGVPTSAPVPPSQVEQAVPRTPLIIATPSTMPVTDGTVAPPTDRKPKSRQETNRRRAKAPASQHGRVRALAIYGMTLGEVTDLYGVSVDVIERIVAEEPDDRSSAIV